MEQVTLAEIEYAQVEPTTRCNFRCGFCAGRKMKSADMSPELFLRVLDIFPRLRHIELQGEGEPLLHPEYFHLAGEARKRSIRVSTITNGSLLDADAVSQLLDLQFEKVCVSIETADPRLFAIIRGGSLQRTVSGIERLLRERRRRGLSRPLVGFANTILRRTLGSFADIVSLYRELGMDGGIDTQLLMRMESYTSAYDAEMQNDLIDEEEADVFWKMRTPLKQYFPTLAGVGFYAELYVQPRPPTACAWLERAILVSVDGSMTPCCRIKNAARFGYGTIGHLETKRYLENRETMRAQLKQGIIPAACRYCVKAEAIRNCARTTIDRVAPDQSDGEAPRSC